MADRAGVDVPDAMPGWDQAEAQRRLGAAVGIWHTARLGLELLQADPDNLIHGLRIVAAFGRSTTFALQRLHGVPGLPFDEWYAREVAAMQADPLMNLFQKYRNAVLKRGELPGLTVQISWSNVVLGDDPSVDPFAAVPMEISASIQDGSSPQAAVPVEELCFRYLDYLLSLLRRAAAEFGLLMPA